jgi:hypothetical protein
MSAPSPVTSILDAGTDVYGVDFSPESSPAGTSPALAIVPRRTLRGHVSAVDYIADTIERMDEESMTPEVRDALSAELVAELAGTRAKVDSTCAVLAMWDGLEASARKEIERLTKRAERFARSRERLELHVQAVMTASGLEKLDGETSSLALRRNPPAVVIDETTTLGHEFLFFPEAPPPRPDRTAIRKALIAGRKIAGCHLERGVRLVRS